MAETLYTDIGTVPSTVGSILTNGASETNEVLVISFHNTNTTSEVLELHFVPNSGGALGTAAVTNRIEYVSIAANATYHWERKGPSVLRSENDSIQAKTTTASKVTYLITRIENA